MPQNQGDLKFLTSFYHCKSFNEFEFKKNQLITVKGGKIVSIQEASGDIDSDTVVIPGFMIPGFIDTHIHSPQYVFTGTGYDLGLLEWLQKYTFPKECQFDDLKHTRNVYEKVVSKTLKNGTTCASYYATIHPHSSLELARICVEKGQRGFIGKVNMDRNSPDYYTETTESSLRDTREFVKNVLGLESDLVVPCITPRFVPTCTSELMLGLAAIAKEFNLPIQSHLSENKNEISWVQQLHPESETYSHVYYDHGLLNKNTIMAHCIHLEPKERELLREQQVGISHCPNSNFCLHSGVMNVRRLVQEGFEKIGLGTDCAGGYSPSLMDSMRQALIASKVIHIESRNETAKEQFDALHYYHVFYLATLGSAKVLNLDHKLGNFEVGKEFDALVIDMSGIDLFDHDDEYTRFEKFIYLGDDRHIKQVYVQGKQVI
jgi:guanine deaminase